nr:MAG TPA: hypothetical protein [Caudoviricetes sp.]
MFPSVFVTCVTPRFTLSDGHPSTLSFFPV